MQSAHCCDATWFLAQSIRVTYLMLTKSAPGQRRDNRRHQEMSKIMSTETIRFGFAPAVATTTDKPGSGFLKRVFDRLIAARTRQAEAHVGAMLARMDDRRLADMGLTREDIATIRATGRMPAR